MTVLVLNKWYDALAIEARVPRINSHGAGPCRCRRDGALHARAERRDLDADRDAMGKVAWMTQELAAEREQINHERGSTPVATYCSDGPERIADV